MAVSFFALIMAGIVIIFLLGMIAMAAAVVITQCSRGPRFSVAAPQAELEDRLQKLYARLEKVERFQRRLVVAWLLWVFLALAGFVLLVSFSGGPAWMGFEKGVVGMFLLFMSCLISTVTAAWMKRALHEDILELGLFLDRKRKNEELDADKPGRQYRLGDDGELIELEDDPPLRQEGGKYR
jgi:hypothetical protein